MPRVPKLRRHVTGRGFVEIKGRRIYCGPWKGKKPAAQTVETYHRILAEVASVGAPLPKVQQSEITVAEVCATFYKWAKGYYVPNEAERVRIALLGATTLYGSTEAARFGPKALGIVRDSWIEEGYARSTVNSMTGCVKRAFRWAAAQELIPGDVVAGLNCLPGLRKGRSAAKEPMPVGPVDLVAVRAAQAKVGPVVGAMIEIQLLTGARPGEIVHLRRRDIDDAGDVWTARVTAHKNEHRGHTRTLYIGPKAQAILRPYLLREPGAYLFSPKDARRLASADADSPRRPNQKPTPRKSKRRVGERYSVGSYRVAVKRACEAAGVTVWTPNQLRHTRATEVRKLFGLDGAQVVLGHANADVTQVYAETDAQRAKEIMRAIG